MKNSNIERVLEVVLNHVDQQLAYVARTGKAPWSAWLDHVRNEVRAELRKLPDEEGRK